MKPLETLYRPAMSIYLVLLPLLLTGCIGTKVSNYMASYTDVDFAARQYGKLALHFDTTSLQDRKQFERVIAEQFEEEEIPLRESGSIIPPTRQWDSSGIASALQRAGIDGYLRITETAHRIDSVWIPPTTKVTIEKKGEERSSSTPRKGEKEKSDSIVTTSERQVISEQTTGGYMHPVLHRSFRIELIDIASGRVAWIGMYDMEGTANDYVEWFGRRLVRQLIVDRKVNG